MEYWQFGQWPYNSWFNQAFNISWEQPVRTSEAWQYNQNWEMKQNRQLKEVKVEPQKQVKSQEQKNIITRICEAAMPRQGRKHAFWWNEKTARLRLESLRAFRTYRQFQRQRWRNGANYRAGCDILFERYKTANRIKRSAMRRAKALAWADLLSRIDEGDPCVRSFKPFLSHLIPPLVSRRNINFLLQVVDKLSPVFPLRGSTNPGEHSIKLEDQTAALKTPDKIVKRVHSLLERVLGDSLKLCLERSNFPDIWKLTLLVLLKKDGVPSVLPFACQPIPLKREFESDILFQIMYHMNDVDRKPIPDAAANPKAEAWCFLWRCVHRGLHRHGIPPELINLLGEYLRSHCSMKNMCVIPHESVLCPLLLGVVHGAGARPIPDGI